MLCLGLAFGCFVWIAIAQMKEQTAALGRDIRHDLAQIEAMALGRSLRASASLLRIHTNVKHELTTQSAHN
jgi:hypothetical protein